MNVPSAHNVSAKLKTIPGHCTDSIVLSLCITHFCDDLSSFCQRTIFDASPQISSLIVNTFPEVGFLMKKGCVNRNDNDCVSKIVTVFE